MWKDGMSFEYIFKKYFSRRVLSTSHCSFPATWSS